MLVLVFVFCVPRRPLLPRRVGVAGVPGGVGPASVAGVAGSAGIAGVAGGSPGDAGIAGIAGVALGRVRRARVTRDAPAGVNEQTRPESATGVNVRRSPDFLARMEMMVGTVPG